MRNFKTVVKKYKDFCFDVVSLIDGEISECRLTLELTEDVDRGDYYTPSYREVIITDVLDSFVDDVEIDYNVLNTNYVVKRKGKELTPDDYISVLELTPDDYISVLESEGFFSDEVFDEEDSYYDIR